MGNEVATQAAAAPRRSVIQTMANRYGMEADTFEATVRKTCMPTGQNIAPMTREEFAAGIMVAENYSLNPILREIYFYPRKGGGIVPVVSIDGWVSLVNRHPQFDGIEFKDLHDDANNLVSITCTIFRKDRTRPTIVTEYFKECWRDTIPWKMPHRMLRHKALIQTARYAFGFAGIHDEDEAERILNATATRALSGPGAPPPDAVEETPHDAATGEIHDAEFTEGQGQETANDSTQATQEPASGKDEVEDAFVPATWLQEVAETLATCQTESDVEEAHEMFRDTAEDMLTRNDREQFDETFAAAFKRFEKPKAEEPKAEVEKPAEQQPIAKAGPGVPPADDDDEEAQPEPEPNHVEKHQAWLDRQYAKPGLTSEDVKKIWTHSSPTRKDLINDGHMTVDDRKAMHAQMTELFNRLYAAETAPEGGDGEASTEAKPDAPQGDGGGDERAQKIAAFTAEMTEKLAALTTIQDVNMLLTETLPIRNALVAPDGDKPQQDAWKKMFIDRRTELHAGS